jgi:hypothetical protein
VIDDAEAAALVNSYIQMFDCKAVKKEQLVKGAISDSEAKSDF